jgi:hypothetical protein
MVRSHELRKVLALILIFLSFSAIVCAQENNDTSSFPLQIDQPASQNTIGTNQENPSNQGQNVAPTDDKQKSTSVELPAFSYKNTKESWLGRSFVLSIGLFPFTYFYTGTALDIVRFAAHNFSADYAPWPFKTQYSVALTNEEMWWKLGIASGTSVLFGILGAILK